MVATVMWRVEKVGGGLAKWNLFKWLKSMKDKEKVVRKKTKWLSSERIKCERESEINGHYLPSHYPWKKSLIYLIYVWFVRIETKSYTYTHILMKL